MVSQPALILLRGLPGSGKTTLAKLLTEEGKYPCYSVDDYFTDPLTGEYRFEYQNNHLAYKQCEENTRAAMLNGSSKIFVHNTFTIDWELESYFKMASEHHYNLFVVTVENHHKHKNVHAISNEQIAKMAEKYKVKLL